MPSSHPLLHRFENYFVVGEHHLEWTTFGEDFFFRPRDAHTEVIWCASRCAHYGRQLMFPRQSKKVLHNLKKQITSNYTWRYFPVSKNCELFLSGLIGLVRVHQVEGLVGLRFCDGNSLSSMSLSNPVDIAKVVQINQPNIEQIRKAVDCPLQDRGWSNVHWPWGTQQQLKDILRAMAAIVRLPEHETGQWRFQVRNRFDSYIFSDNPRRTKVTPEKTTYEPFIQCLRSHFPVKIDKMAFRTDKGVEREEIWPSLIVSLEMPTAHEKLEALLLWRDFLRDKIPATEIDELLRPFC